MKPINRIFLFLLFYKRFIRRQLCTGESILFLAYHRKRTKFIFYIQDVQCHNIGYYPFESRCDEKIYAGQTIKIPKGKESQKGETFHTIQAGETLYKLTTMYNISAKDIWKRIRD